MLLDSSLQRAVGWRNHDNIRSSPDYLVLTYSFDGFVWIMSDNFLWFMSSIYRSHCGVFRITEQVEIEVSGDWDSSEGICTYK